MFSAVRASQLLFALVASTSVAQEQSVTAFLIAPSDVAEMRSLERLVEATPTHKAKWNQHRDASLTYVVTQRFTSLIVNHPCEGVRIRVTVSRGRLRSAKYDESADGCGRGQPAPRSVPNARDRLFTPDEFFELLAKAPSQLECYRRNGGCTALRAAFHDTFGFPIKIEDYSENLSDYYWSLEVSDIEVLP